MKNIITLILFVCLGSTCSAQWLEFDIKPVVECVTFNKFKAKAISIGSDSVLVKKRLYSTEHRNVKDTMYYVATSVYNSAIKAKGSGNKEDRDAIEQPFCVAIKDDSDE